MARNSKAGSKRKPVPKPTVADGKGRLRRGRRKVCQFCAQHSEWVDYKDINTLRRYMNDRGRIRARGATRTCRQHQRDVAVAIEPRGSWPSSRTPCGASRSGPGERRGGPRADRSVGPSLGRAGSHRDGRVRSQRMCPTSRDPESTSLSARHPHRPGPAARGGTEAGGAPSVALTIQARSRSTTASRRTRSSSDKELSVFTCAASRSRRDDSSPRTRPDRRPATGERRGERLAGRQPPPPDQAHD